MVRESVSGTASKDIRPPPRSTTVRQAPLQATLSPGTSSSTGRLPGRMVMRAPPALGSSRSTTPMSEISPVNIGEES